MHPLLSEFSVHGKLESVDVPLQLVPTAATNAT